MTENAANFWTDQTSVLFTSFWGWSPETWGCVGWTNNDGRTHRDKLLNELSDPFITICSVTGNQDYIDPDLKGMIAGFFLVSHETCDRDDFTHPHQHVLAPEKWRHSLKALRAFNYVPEHRLSVREFDPTLVVRARPVSRWGEVLSDPAQITRLRETPWVEVDVYTPTANASQVEDFFQTNGKVKAGPASKDGYVVSSGTQELARQLYVLRLIGDTNAYLGEPAAGRSIYKIGLSVSPELRRQAFQRSMPRGAFRWCVDRTSDKAGFESFSFRAAVAGEDAMKEHLATSSTWLGGEFYLASEAELDEAWRLGHAAAKSFGGSE